MKIKSCAHQSHHKDQMDNELKAAIQSLKEAGLRCTGQRKDILKTLIKANKPFSSEEVFQKISSADLVTIYRSLAAMEEAGLLRRYDFGDGIKRYELALGKHHHHYVICRSCGTAETFDACSFNQLAQKTVEKLGYTNIQHQLEVFATCSACSA